MRAKILSISVIFVLLLSACAPAAAPAQEVTLTVLAAASLTESFTELAAQFEDQHPGVTVAYSFAGSQALAQQLAQGAPADVFASASNRYMTEAIDAGRVAEGASSTFALNRLVVIYPSANPAGLQALTDLTKPGLKLDLADESVPVGEYTLDFLDKASGDPAYGATFKDDVLANVVSYEDNVKAVVTKVALGEADAGVVYVTDAAAEAAKLGQLDIPDELNTIATYPIAAIQDSANAELAAAFVQLVLSAEGQTILGKYGFLPPK